MIVIPATGASGPGGRGLRHDTADLERDRRVASTRARRSRARLLSPHGSFSAWAALLVVWLVWGSTYLAIRVADQSIPPFAMAAARYLTAGAVLYLAAWLGGRRRGGRRRPRRRQQGPAGRASSRLAQWGGMAVVGTLLLAFGNGGVSSRSRPCPRGWPRCLSPASRCGWRWPTGSSTGSGSPLRGWLALVIGLAGIAVLARPSGNGAVLPVLVVLGASVSWGVGSVLAGRCPRRPARWSAARWRC